MLPSISLGKHIDGDRFTQRTFRKLTSHPCGYWKWLILPQSPLPDVQQFLVNSGFLLYLFLLIATFGFHAPAIFNLCNLYRENIRLPHEEINVSWRQGCKSIRNHPIASRLLLLWYLFFFYLHFAYSYIMFLLLFGKKKPAAQLKLFWTSRGAEVYLIPNSPQDLGF